MDVYVVIEEDRHCDVEVTVFGSEIDAVEYAGTQLEGILMDGDEIKVLLTDSWLKDGCVWNIGYGNEGDGIRVMKRELQGRRP